jgi:hypothetical protein
MNCDAARTYRQTVRDRQEKEAQTLAQLTGWHLSDIRKRIQFMEGQSQPWWRNLWPVR